MSTNARIIANLLDQVESLKATNALLRRPMPRRLIPNTDLQVSVVCLGTWQFCGGDSTWCSMEYDQMKAIVKAALEVGINFFDCAECYGHGASETVLGKILRDLGVSRSSFVIADKFGKHKGEDAMAYKASDIREAVEDSLERLQMDYIDLYQIHWAANVHDFEECINELKKLQAERKILHYGVCNFGPNDSKKLMKCGGLATSNQLPYNLLWRNIEHGIVPVAAEDNWGILAYSPLQQGLLTGKFSCAAEVPEGRRRTRHFAGDSTSLSRHGQEGCEEETFSAISALQKMCDREGMAMGASRPSQVAANAKLPALSAELVAECNCVTDALKQKLGSNPDMWAKTSRFN